MLSAPAGGQFIQGRLQIRGRKKDPGWLGSCKRSSTNPGKAKSAEPESNAKRILIHGFFILSRAENTASKGGFDETVTLSGSVFAPYFDTLNAIVPTFLNLYLSYIL
jgi:hypothetical protein